MEGGADWCERQAGVDRFAAVEHTVRSWRYRGRLHELCFGFKEVELPRRDPGFSDQFNHLTCRHAPRVGQVVSWQEEAKKSEEN